MPYPVRKIQQESPCADGTAVTVQLRIFHLNIYFDVRMRKEYQFYRKLSIGCFPKDGRGGVGALHKNRRCMAQIVEELSFKTIP